MYGVKNRVVHMSVQDWDRYATWRRENVTHVGETAYRVGTQIFFSSQDVRNHFMEVTCEHVLDLKFDDRRDYYGE